MWPFKRPLRTSIAFTQPQASAASEPDSIWDIQRFFARNQELRQIASFGERERWPEIERRCRELIQESPNWRAYLAAENRRMIEQSTRSGIPAQLFVVSLMTFTGYDVLVTLMEHQGRLHQALEIAQQAYAEGWGGGWGRRVARLQALQREGASRAAQIPNDAVVMEVATSQNDASATIACR